MVDEPQQTPAPAPAGGVPDIPIDPNLAKRVIGLYQGIDKVLTEMRVPRYERAEVEKNLMEAVAADLLARLGSKMSDQEKEELVTMTGAIDQRDLTPTNPDLLKVAGFFRDKFSQEELVTALAEATEGILKDFVEEMGKNKKPS